MTTERDPLDDYIAELVLMPWERDTRQPAPAPKPGPTLREMLWPEGEA